MKDLTLDLEDRGSVKLVVVRGFMNMANVPRFEQTLEQLIGSGVRDIVLDFSGLEYISSAGLGEIIARIRDLRREGGDIKVGGYSHLVYDILKTFGFTDVFDTFPTPEEAIRKFTKPSKG